VLAQGRAAARAPGSPRPSSGSVQEISLESPKSAQPYATAATALWQRAGGLAEVAQERTGACDRHDRPATTSRTYELHVDLFPPARGGRSPREVDRQSGGTVLLVGRPVARHRTGSARLAGAKNVTLERILIGVLKGFCVRAGDAEWCAAAARHDGDDASAFIARWR